MGPRAVRACRRHKIRLDRIGFLICGRRPMIYIANPYKSCLEASRIHTKKQKKKKPPKAASGCPGMPATQNPIRSNRISYMRTPSNDLYSKSLQILPRGLKDTQKKEKKEAVRACRRH